MKKEIKGGGLTKEKIKSTTAVSLAADLLHEASRKVLGDLQITLIQVRDSGLLESQPTLSEMVETELNEIEALEPRLRAFFTQSLNGHPSFLARAHSNPLEHQIELFRQEVFWTMGSRAEILASEELIQEMLDIYASVAVLVSLLDFKNEWGGPSRRIPVFARPLAANPFLALAS